MADEGIMATTLQVQDKVGVDANATSNAETFINAVVLQAENILNSSVEFDFSANFAGLTIKVKGLCTSFVSAWAAVRVIGYDPNSVGRTTATLKINILTEEYTDALKQLQNLNVQTFMTENTT